VIAAAQTVAAHVYSQSLARGNAAQRADSRTRHRHRRTVCRALRSHHRLMA